jgi:hypothetical protein
MELPSTHKHALFVACGESVTAVIAKTEVSDYR